MKYRVISAEPGYSGSERVEGSNLTLNKAVSRVSQLRRDYIADCDNNPSYAEIIVEGTEENVWEWPELDSPFDLMDLAQQMSGRIASIKAGRD